MGVQVTELTLNKKCHEKEFIDFEFDGKHISEFGMVAVADGGRHSFDAAPTFQDETSSVNGVDGQYYWGTHFGSKKMSFTLATDGMTEAQVNAFKQHFRPGKYGKFIEDKLACRYNYARVSQVVTFNVVPFRIKKKINGVDIYVNEYKGDCRITFEFDDPYFKTTRNYIENDTKDKEQLRAMYVNGIPMPNSFGGKTGLGVCSIGDDTYCFQSKRLTRIENAIGYSYLVFYNPGTAKTKVKIEIIFTPGFTLQFPIYFNNICDDINTLNTNPKQPPYNQIKVTESKEFNSLNYLDSFNFIDIFKYTSPDVIYFINKAISMADKFNNSTLNEFEEQLRMEIFHPKVMAWAASVLRIIATKNEFYNKNTDNFNTETILVDCSSINKDLKEKQKLNWKKYFNIFMLYMLANFEPSDPNNTSSNLNYHIESDDYNHTFSNYTIVFDGTQNKTTMNYNYNQIINNLEKFEQEEEDCGNMILSDYLTLDGGDILKDNKIFSVHLMGFFNGNIRTNTTGCSIYYTPTYY